MSFFEKVSELAVEYPWQTAAVVGGVVGVGVGVGYYSHGRKTKADISALVSEKERLALSLKAATAAPVAPAAPAAQSAEFIKMKKLMDAIEAVPGAVETLTPAELVEYNQLKAVLTAMGV